MGHGGIHSGVSGCGKLDSGRGCVGEVGRGGGDGHGVGECVAPGMGVCGGVWWVDGLVCGHGGAGWEG